MKVENAVLQHSYEVVKHPSGLTILLYEMAGYEGTSVQFGTHFGSLDSGFRLGEGEMYHPPLGVAHFLEHKLFEQEYGDAFERFGTTGANANAFTSFDRTVYLFHCTDQLEASLEILLQFVTTPYFTKEGVDKEQGIIAQEIGMYDDEPHSKVFYNTLACLYQNHPVKEEIIGTVESISRITPEVLHRCYGTFYNLRNMALSVVGKFDREKVLALCDKYLKEAPPLTLEREQVQEPREVACKKKEAHFPVSMPLFEIGFKELPFAAGDDSFTLRTQLELILACLAGHTSKLFNQLYQEGLINHSFSSEVFEGSGYLSLLFGGESSDPEQVYERLVAEIARLKQEGLDEGQFQMLKKAVYGENVRSFESAPYLADSLLVNHFTGETLFDTIGKVKDITFEDTNELLQKVLNVEYSAISIVREALAC